MTTFQVDFEPVGRRVVVSSEETLLAAAQGAGITLAAVCGGVGVCGACKVRLMAGELTAFSESEWAVFDPGALAEGWRLACQAYPRSDLKIEIPPESLTSTQRLQMEGVAGEVSLSPAIRMAPVRLSAPDAADLRADWSRFIETFPDLKQEETVTPAVLAQFSTLMREQGWQGQAVFHQDGAVVGFLPAGQSVFGLAVDIGTTKMAAYLVDLTTGATVAKDGAMNPQIAYGEDVVARIAYANQGEAQRLTLQRRVVESLNALLKALCAQAGVNPDQVVDMVVVGNTAMHHLFAGLPVRQLGQAPYVAAVGQALRFPAREVGLVGAPNAQVYLPPNIAGYVGADHIAMLLASGLDAPPGVAIALDIGTNTEISLAKAGRLFSCSCASGPAFEGAHIRAGMRAVPGAIERAQFFEGDWHLATVGNAAPIGICGSGILDVVAELLASGQMDAAGRFTERTVRRVPFKGGDAIELVTSERSGTGKPILVTRHDIREIQLAKAAIRAGMEVLLAHTCTQPDEIGHFIVAGAFGTYLNLASAVRIGMFPRLPGAHYHQIGNAAGAGAQMMLTSSPARSKAEAFLQKMTYLELTSQPDFMDVYVDAMGFDLQAEEH